MATALTHASFFSGAGGLDLGLERAGWRTVAVSEIDPYACAVLTERWPGVPNLGDIQRLADGWRRGQSAERTSLGCQCTWTESGHRTGCPYGAHLWTGGFPCQDLSVAGKRAGLAGERSGLAFAFLDLVEQHRPPVVLLENVPGLLSSHGGADLLALAGRLVDLGYGWAFRVFDASVFGVPQRRRRVFILALRCGDDDPGGRVAAERAGQVLAVGTRCGRDHTAEREAWAGLAPGTGRSAHGVVADGATTTRTLAAAMGHHGYTLGAQDADGGYVQLVQQRLDGAPPDTDGVRAPDGLAGQMDGGDGVADLDPPGRDSHRYRVIGNGVAAPVAEWLGMRLRRYLEGTL